MSEIRVWGSVVSAVTFRCCLSVMLQHAKNFNPGRGIYDPIVRGCYPSAERAEWTRPNALNRCNIKSGRRPLPSRLPLLIELLAAPSPIHRPRADVFAFNRRFAPARFLRFGADDVGVEEQSLLNDTRDLTQKNPTPRFPRATTCTPRSLHYSPRLDTMD